jgi:hypothetical protein
MTLSQEAVKLIRADRVVAEPVEHDEKVVAKVVDLGQVRVLHRVPHSERVETELLRHRHELGRVVAADTDVEPDPSR